MRLSYTQVLHLACVLVAVSSVKAAEKKPELDSQTFQRKQLPLPVPFGVPRRPLMPSPWFNPWPFAPAWGRGGLQLPSAAFFNLPTAGQTTTTPPPSTTENTEETEATTTTKKPRRTTVKPKNIVEPKSALVPPPKPGSQRRYSPYRYLLDQTTTTQKPPRRRHDEEESQEKRRKKKKKNTTRRSQQPGKYITVPSPPVNQNFIRRPPSITPFLHPFNANFYLSGNPFGYLRPPPLPPRFVKTTPTTTTTSTTTKIPDEKDEEVVFHAFESQEVPVLHGHGQPWVFPTEVSPQYSFERAQQSADSWVPFEAPSHGHGHGHQQIDDQQPVQTASNPQLVESSDVRVFNMSASIGFGDNFKQGQVLTASSPLADDLSAEGSSISSPAASSSSFTPKTVKFPLSRFGNRDIHVDPNARIEQIFSLNRTSQLTPFAQFVKNNGQKYRTRLPSWFKQSETNFIEDFPPSDDESEKLKPTFDTWNNPVDTEYITSSEDDDKSAIPDEAVPGRFWDRNPWRPMSPFLKPPEESSVTRRPFYGEADDVRLASNLGLFGQTNEIDRALNKQQAGSKKKLFADSLPTVRPHQTPRTSTTTRPTTTTQRTAPPAFYRSTLRFRTPGSATTTRQSTTTSKPTTTTESTPSSIVPFIVTSSPLDEPVKKASGASNELLESQGAVESQRSTQYFLVNRGKVKAKEAANDINDNRVRLQPLSSWSSSSISTPTSKKSILLFFPPTTPTQQSMAELATFFQKHDKKSSTTPSSIFPTFFRGQTKPMTIINSDFDWSNREQSSTSKDKRPWPFSSASGDSKSGSEVRPKLQIIRFHAPEKQADGSKQTQDSFLDFDDLKNVKEKADTKVDPENQEPDSTTRYYDLRGQEFSPEDVTFAAPHLDHNTDEALKYWQRVVQSKHGEGNKQVHYASIPVIKRKGDTLSWELLEVPLYWNKGRVPAGISDYARLGFSLENDTDNSRGSGEHTKPFSSAFEAVKNGSRQAIFLSKELASSREDDEDKPAAIYLATSQPTATQAPPKVQPHVPRTITTTTTTAKPSSAGSTDDDDEDYDWMDAKEDDSTTEMPNIMDLFPEYDWMEGPAEPPQSKLMMSIPSSISIENLKLESAPAGDEVDNQKAKPKATWVQKGLNDARQLTATRKPTEKVIITSKVDRKTHPQRAFAIIADRQDRNNRPAAKSLPKQPNSNELEDDEPLVPEALQYVPDPLRPLNSEAVRRIKEFPDSIPGMPGVHYPTYTMIPETDFNCSDQQWPGYYADTQTDCQVWHLCAPNKSAAFLCPAGTLFNQAAMICDLWDNVPHCDLAPQLYYLNSLFVDIFLDASASAGPVKNRTSTSRR